MLISAQFCKFLKYFLPKLVNSLMYNQWNKFYNFHIFQSEIIAFNKFAEKKKNKTIFIFYNILSGEIGLRKP